MELGVQGGSSDSERSLPTGERSCTADSKADLRVEGKENFCVIV